MAGRLLATIFSSEKFDKDVNERVFRQATSLRAWDHSDPGVRELSVRLRNEQAGYVKIRSI